MRVRPHLVYATRSMRPNDDVHNSMRSAVPLSPADAAGRRVLRTYWGHPRISREALQLAGILLAGLALRLWLLTRGTPTLDSDEATVGLMGLHLLHGEWTPFYWGQAYMGSLEAALVAPFLWLLGPTPFALRLAPLLVGLGFVATVYLLGRRLFSSGVGLVAAALLALGPPFFVVLSLRALGGYVETLLLGNLLLLLALTRREGGPLRSAPAALLFGVLAGLALWTNLLVLPFVLAAGAIIGWRAAYAHRMPFRRPPRAQMLALVGGLLVGGLPAIVYNITHGGVTLATILGMTAIGAHGGHAPTASPLANVWSELTIALPILGGTAFGGTQSTGLTAGEYMAAAAAHPVTYAVALLVAVAALALLVAAGVSLIRRWRAMGCALEAADAQTGSDVTGDAASERQLTLAGEVALLGIAGCYLVAFALSKQPDIATAPRYLLPLYAALPLIVRQAHVLITTVRQRVATRMAERAAVRSDVAAGMTLARALPVVGLAALLLWNVAGDLSLTPLRTAARDHGIWIAGSDDNLLRLLAAHHVRTVISNDYWEGLRLTYESGEHVIAVMVTPEGHTGFNRYQPYVERGLADPRPAYVELLGTREMTLRQAQLARGDLAGYVLVISGQFGVFLPV